MATPPRQRARPLPPIPVSVPSLADPLLGNTPPYNLSSTYRRSSTITIASAADSVYTIQTVLPSYSTIDLISTDVQNEGAEPEAPAYDGSGATPSTMLDLPPDLSPPRYSVLPSGISTTPPPTTLVDQPQGREKGLVGLGRKSRRRSGFAQHQLCLRKSGAVKPWATLRLISRPPLPGSGAQTPRFIGGDAVKGVLELELDNPMSVQSITMNLRGGVMTCYLERSTLESRDFVFLDHTHEVYSKKVTGDPRRFGQCEVSKCRIFNGKMQGLYHFPFSFSFPTTVALGDGQGGVPCLNYELPPTFLERESGGTIRYNLELTIDHGRLKLNNNVNTSIIYVPRIIAPPASRKRQLAYREGALLPAPQNDPNGWKSVSSVRLVGQYHERSAEVSCTLYLAEPLCYTRGTVLPCYVALSSSDYQLLEHLASPKMMEVRLSRHVVYYSDGNIAPNLCRQNIAREEEITCFGSAAWWRPPKSEEPETLDTRWLEGEIHLSKDLQPSCDYPPFTIEYSVEMMPFSFEIFAVNDQGGSRQCPIISQVVRIATFHQYGPIPTRFMHKNSGRAKDLEQSRIAPGGPGLLHSVSIRVGNGSPF